MGRYLAVAGVNMPVLRVDSSSGETRALQRFPCSSYDVSVRPDGKRIAVPCDNGKGYLLDADTGTYKTLQGHTEEVNEAIFSPNGKLVASVGDDGTVRVWTANSGIPFGKPGAHRITSAHVQPPRLASTRPRAVTRTGNAAQRPGRAGSVSHTRAVSFSPDGTNVCVLNHDGQVSQWSSSAKGPIAAARFDDVVRVVSSAAGCAVQRRKLVELLTTSSRAQSSISPTRRDTRRPHRRGLSHSVENSPSPLHPREPNASAGM